MTTEGPSNGNIAEVSTTTKEHEDPSLSSASLAIELELLGTTFRPVFTHQAFPGEHIRGYHPPLTTMMEMNSTTTIALDEDDESESAVLLHSSHVHHQAASKELSIHVELAPSCETCHVELDTEQKRLPRRRATRRASKRRRVNSNADNENNNNNIDGENINKGGEDKSRNNALQENANNEDNNIPSDDPEVDDVEEEEEEASYNDEEEEEKDDSEFEVDADDNGNESEVEQDEKQKEGTTRGARMPTKEILHNLKKGLPTVQKKAEDAFLRRPLGVELKEYTVHNNSNGNSDDDEKTFVLCLADGSQVVEYHTQVQRLALWFIETADEVDVASQEGGYWKVLYLFQKHKRTQYSLAGYVTLFHFHAPFKKPKPGIVVRICQALVLPPYQRSGHGKHMLTCLMDVAHGRYANQLVGATTKSKGGGEDNEDDIVEINVESPAPAFVMLRNRTDLDCFVRSLESEKPWVPHDNTTDKPSVTDPDFFSALSETELVQAAVTAKIIPRQIQIVMELFKLHQLQKHFKSDSSQDDKDELEKRFRLMVKKRLNREHREDLSGFRTKAEKQAFLNEEFQKCYSSYLVTLPK